MEESAKLRQYWEKEYERTDTPFDIDAPDEWIADLEQRGQIRGNILDAGCGTGRTSIFLAKLGYSVTGVDISANAVERAARKTVSGEFHIRFIQANICEWIGCDNFFDTVIDIGCFHSLFTENDRKSYASTLQRVCKAGAVVYLRAISEANLQREEKSRRAFPAMSEASIRSAFEVGWIVNSMAHREIDLLTDNGRKKAYCWFAEIKREQE
ncbi:MAG: methyltransferase domain-containing protein [Synergistaceae bacterium]|jgi:cyclopropane fatty-acyl-phospholipid synthase-like methyltransferase|nr:methyltransferase domain-containing protein [Synergistaceae bacterium]